MEKQNKKVVIAGSASLQDAAMKWKQYWEEKEHAVVLDFSKAIPRESFVEEYPKVHKTFFENIEKADVLCIANEDKNGIEGYIGAEVFAELVYAVVQNLLHDKHIDVVLVKMPSKEVQSYEEISLWIQLGWIRIL